MKYLKRLGIGMSALLIGCGPQIQKLHHDAFVADSHCDILLRTMNGEDVSKLTTSGHADIPRFYEGGVDLEVFIIWVDPYRFVPVGSYDRGNEMIDSLEALEIKSKDKLRIVRKFSDIIQNEEDGVLSAMIGLEGGHPIENDLKKLEYFYKRGVRYLGITWNNSNDWATSAKDEVNNDSLSFRGLTDFGRDVIRKCDELGIMVDVSHSGEQTFWDILEVSTKPIIASHSCVYNMCNHYRNLKDDQLKAIRDKDGVAFVNFYPAYLDSMFTEREAEVHKKYKTELDQMKDEFGEDSDEYWYGSMELMKVDMQAIAPEVDLLIDHIDYIAKLIGVDHVGIGSDFDGVEVLPKGLEDVTKLPIITQKLLERGYSEQDIKKILGENFKRVFRDVIEK